VYPISTFVRNPLILCLHDLDQGEGKRANDIFQEPHQYPDSTWRYRPPLPSVGREDDGDGGTAFSKLSAAGCFFRRDGQIF